MAGSSGPTNSALEDLADTVFIAGRQEPASNRTRRRRARYRTGAEGRISHLKRGYGLTDPAQRRPGPADLDGMGDPQLQRRHPRRPRPMKH